MSKESAMNTAQAIVTTVPAIQQTPDTSNPGLAPATEPKDERFEALTRKESALVKERQALSAEKAAVNAEREKMKSIQAKVQQFEDMKIKNPVQALKGLGFTEDDIFNFLAQSEQTVDPVKAATEAAQAEIKAFKDEQEKVARDATSQRNEQVLTKFRSDIASTVTSDPDTYEYINHRGQEAQDLVYEEVAAELQATGKIITIAEAAARVEAAYEEDDKAMSGIKKRGGGERPTALPVEAMKAEVSPRPTTGQTAQGQRSLVQSPKTLSNRVSNTVSANAPKVESREQKRERLMATLRQGLRK